MDESIQLGYDENNLSISFLAINYKMHGKVHYRYRMDDGEWIRTQNLSVNFLELPPGERFFEVQAQNEDGIWSESACLPFVIRPPWWATAWAGMSLALLVVAIAIGIYKYRTHQLKEAYQTQLQIANLERSALQAQMNPHFIFNCLNSIQNFILQNEQQAAIQYLGSFASLVRSMLNASVAEKITLAEEVELLNNYLKLEKLRFKNRFDYTVSLVNGLDQYEVKIPPLLVQPYVENAVKHGISRKTDGGKVEVIFDIKGNYLEVIIQDNGAGFAATTEPLQKNQPHKSFGMSITRHRLDLLSNKKELNTVNSKTLYDEEARVAGTQVVIQIRLSEV